MPYAALKQEDGINLSSMLHSTNEFGTINHAELFDKVFSTQNGFNETEEALAVAWSFHCAKDD